jgi:hypothetical protein
MAEAPYNAYVFTGVNESTPVIPEDIDANELSAIFTGLADGTAIQDEKICIRHLSPELSEKTSIGITKTYTGISGTDSIVLTHTPDSRESALVFFDDTPQTLDEGYEIDIATKTLKMAQEIVAENRIVIHYHHIGD